MTSKDACGMEKMRYNGPGRLGVRPGSRFCFTLPLTGCRSIVMDAAPDLPGLSFCPSRRTLSGTVERAGSRMLRFWAEGSGGELSFNVELVAGENIALSPPMGWNSWYCFSESVSDVKIREAARGMAERGLSRHGWSYINIDDCWQGERRNGNGPLSGNERFPDMAGLADFVHSLGLKFGIYSTPWIGSYSGFRGGSSDSGKGKSTSLPPERRLQPNQIYGRYPGGEACGAFRVGDRWLMDEDIRQWKEWGVDLVKMDWFPNDVPTTERIAAVLRHCGRDIVLSLSNNAPFELAGPLGRLAQMWRITGDIRDSWESIARIGFELATPWLSYSGPGHWNDLDMLQIGALGIPNTFNTAYRPTALSREEQKSQFALWCMLSAPLILSCDLAGMDDWTYALLTNDAVLAIDQDALGAPATVFSPSPELRIYRKPLADGDMALACFNLSDTTRPCDIPAVAAGAERAVDLWSGESAATKAVLIPPHGSLLFRLVCEPEPAAVL